LLPRLGTEILELISRVARAIVGPAPRPRNPFRPEQPELAMAAWLDSARDCTGPADDCGPGETSAPPDVGMADTCNMERDFDYELSELKQRLLTMASHAERAVNEAVHALVTRDHDLALQVKENDEVLDRFEIEMDELAIKLARAPRGRLAPHHRRNEDFAKPQTRG
jgi:hypothetical protein